MDLILYGDYLIHLIKCSIKQIKPALLPIYWIRRACDKLLHKKEKFSQMYKQYDNVDMKFATDLYEFKKGLGLD